MPKPYREKILRWRVIICHEDQHNRHAYGPSDPDAEFVPIAAPSSEADQDSLPAGSLDETSADLRTSHVEELLPDQHNRRLPVRLMTAKRPPVSKAPAGDAKVSFLLAGE